MPIPTFDQFIEPLLRYLAGRPDGALIAEVQEALATQLQLTDEERLQMLPSGATAVFKSRTGWAHDRLKRAGLSGSPRRGTWQITAAGRALAAKGKLGDDEVDALAAVDRSSRLRPPKDEAVDHMPAPASATTLGSAEGLAPPPPLDRSSPEERIEAALAELRESVARDLLENIARSPPEFFEQVVLDLLHAMGYGTNRSDAQRVGGSGDGGIDGIISLDRLGLEKIYVQAKRWKNTVGSPEIQGFMGALQLQGASKGVFLTTSGFSREARQAAAKARGSIVLVDGEALSTLMMDHGIGVSHKAVRLPKVDNDYFDE